MKRRQFLRKKEKEEVALPRRSISVIPNLAANEQLTLQPLAAVEDDEDDDVMIGAVGDIEDDDDENAEPIALDVKDSQDKEIILNEEQKQLDYEPEEEIIQSYEDLCRKHTETYLASATNFIQETALSKRVAEWNAKLEPLLEEQNKHREFDVHFYSSEVINMFTEKTVLQFNDMVTPLPNYEVCRYFVTALHMVNNGNLNVLKDSESHTVSFQYLSSKSLSEIDNYRAPSVMEDIQDTSSQKQKKGIKRNNNPTKSNKKKITQMIIQ